MTLSKYSYLLVVCCIFMMSCESDKPKQTSKPSLDKSAELSMDVDASTQLDTKSPNKVNNEAAENSIWAGSKYEMTGIDMPLTKLSEHVYYVTGPAGTPTDNEGFMSNAAVVIGSDSVVVFDSLGTPSLAYLLRTKIKTITNKPVKMVIVSHYHADHIYGLQVFKEEGAEIIAPLGAKSYLESEAAESRLKERRDSLHPWVNEDTYIVHPDVYISEKKQIDIGGVILEIDTLGSTHSHGDLMVQVKPDNVLLAGDLIFEGRIPFIAGAKPKTWLQHLSAIDATKLSVIVPGHGPASTQPKQALMDTTNYLSYVHTAMKNAVDELIPFADVYEQTDWSKYKDDPAFRVNRLNAYSVFLELEQQSVAE